MEHTRMREDVPKLLVYWEACAVVITESVQGVEERKTARTHGAGE